MELGASALGAFWFATTGAVVLPPQPHGRPQHPGPERASAQ